MATSRFPTTLSHTSFPTRSENKSRFETNTTIYKTDRGETCPLIYDAGPKPRAFPQSLLHFFLFPQVAADALFKSGRRWPALPADPLALCHFNLKREIRQRKVTSHEVYACVARQTPSLVRKTETDSGTVPGGEENQRSNRSSGPVLPGQGILLWKLHKGRLYRMTKWLEVF